jgi:diguanylate cyclase (GGDEF)-like protein
VPALTPLRTGRTRPSPPHSRVTRGSRLATRLMVLVLVPLTVLMAQAARSAYSRSQTVTQAQQVQDRADALLAVMTVGFKIAAERIPVQTELQGRRFGLGADDLARQLGFQPDGWLERSRRETDAAFAALPGATRLATVHDLVRTARQGELRPDTDAQLKLATQSAENRATELAADLARQTENLDGSSSALRDVVALQLAYEASLLQAELSEGLFGVTARIADVRRTQIALAEEQARYQAIVQEIETMGSDSVRRNSDLIQKSQATKELDRVIEQVITSGKGLTIGARGTTFQDMVTAAVFYRQALSRLAGHQQLVTDAGAVVVSDVARMRAQADESYRDALLLAGIVGLLVLLGALLLSRGVTRPLGDIAERARRIRDGDLSVDSGSNRGPREVVAVGQALDDVVANLRLLEEQATALADGDTDHESLRRAAPGQLGRSLQASVSRLSQSIDAREELQARLRHEATHDRLTGLLNRSSSIVALEQGVARAMRVGGGLAVLMVDLDGLKRINDAEGHSTGDEVLRQTAARLAKAVRGGDVLARLGADEFMVVAEVTGITDAVELGQRIVHDLSGLSAGKVGPVIAPRSGVAPTGVTASVGVSITLDGRGVPATLMRDADAAVRRAKELGGCRLEVFDEELRRQLAERSAIESALSAAMDRGDLSLHYQPIVDAQGRMAGMEALCRWTDPVLGVVSPAVFVPVAEASQLVVELDRWVLGEALRQLAAWHRDGLLPGVYLSVNLSGRHLLGAGVVKDVRDALAESGVDPSVLVLEITETVLLDDLLVAAQHLTELRELGVRVAVDDFGTGYTSIAHLQRLPVDILKIDRSFIADLSTDRGRSLVRLMIDMARALGLGVVAEGVETPQELERLNALGGPLVQGYLLGRPMVPEQIPRWSVPASV